MTTSVLPRSDHKSVIVFQLWLLSAARYWSTSTSSRNGPDSGPAKAKPMPTRPAHSTSAGPMTRARSARPSDQSGRSIRANHQESAG
jgi:hypothetical protein